MKRKHKETIHMPFVAALVIIPEAIRPILSKFATKVSGESVRFLGGMKPIVDEMRADLPHISKNNP